MSEHTDRERVDELLKRIDQITKESEQLRLRIEHIRSSSPEWPDRRRVSRALDDGPSPSIKKPSSR